MINKDRDDTTFIDKYENEYDFNFKDGFTLKATASKEAIKSLLLYKIKDKDIIDYKDILASYLVKEFKKTDCFKLKNEEEREEIIESYQPDINEIKDRIAELKEELKEI